MEKYKILIKQRKNDMYCVKIKSKFLISEKIKISYNNTKMGEN